MSTKKDITSLVANTTPYAFTLVDKKLTSGNWVTSPQPIPPHCENLLAFEAKGVSGTATGAVGWAVYDAKSNGTSVGQMKLIFEDPYSGSNKCSAYTEIPNLHVSVNCPEKGGKINVDWHISLT
jgi:hypothetical protein